MKMAQLLDKYCSYCIVGLIILKFWGLCSKQSFLVVTHNRIKRISWFLTNSRQWMVKGWPRSPSPRGCRSPLPANSPLLSPHLASPSLNRVKSFNKELRRARSFRNAREKSASRNSSAANSRFGTFQLFAKNPVLMNYIWRGNNFLEGKFIDYKNDEKINWILWNIYLIITRLWPPLIKSKY